MLAFGLVLGATISVWDVTRSAAYGLVLLWPALVTLHRELGPRPLKVLLFFAFAVSFIHPMYQVQGYSIIHPVDPLPIRGLHALKWYLTR